MNIFVPADVATMARGVRPYVMVVLHRLVGLPEPAHAHGAVVSTHATKGLAQRQQRARQRALGPDYQVEVYRLISAAGYALVPPAADNRRGRRRQLYRAHFLTEATTP